MKNEVKNPEQTACYLAVDIGGTSVKMGLLRMKGKEEHPGEDRTREKDVPEGEYGAGTEDVQGLPEMVGKWSVPTRIEDGGKQILPDIIHGAKEFLSEKGMSFSDLAGVGIGVPGPVIDSPDGEFIVNRCVNLNWGVRELSKEFREHTGVSTICVLNDANAAALGEYRFGAFGARMGSAGEDAPETAGDAASETAGTCGTELPQSAVVVTLGTGIGGGVILNGKVVAGCFGAAGEIGHIPVSPAHPLLKELLEKGASIRPTADLEYYASANGIARVGNACIDTLAEESELRKEKGDPVTSREIFDAAKKGDPLALRITDFFFVTLGTGLAGIASVMDPAAFIIGGGVSAAGEFLREGLQASYRRVVFHASRETDFYLAQLGNDAGLYGAIVPLLI